MFQAASNADDANIIKTFARISSGAKEAAASVDASSGSIVKGLAAIGGGAKGLWTSLSAFGKIGLVVAAVLALKKAWDWLDDTFTITKKAADNKMNDAFDAYASSKADVESLNSELAETKAKIEELNGKTHLSITDEEELNSLKEQNRLLEMELDLKQKIAREKAVEAGNSAVQDFSKNFGTGTSEKQVDDLISQYEKDYGEGSFSRLTDNDISTAGIYGRDSTLSDKLFRLRAYQQVRSNLASEDNPDLDMLNSYDKSITDLKSELNDDVLKLIGIIDNINSVPEGLRTTGQLEALQQAKTSLDQIYKETDPAKWAEMKLDDFFDLNSIKDEKSKLLDLAKDKKYEGISKDDFSSYFAKVAESSGLKEALGNNFLDIIADAINSEAGVVNVDNIKKNLKNDYSQSKFLGDGKNFRSWIDSLSNEDTEIVYKLSLNADSANWNLEQWLQKLREYKQSSEQFLDDLENNVSKTQSVLEKVGNANALLGKSNNGNSVELDSDQLKEYADALEYVNGAFQLNYEKVKQLNQEKVDEQINANVEAMQKAQAQLLINNQQISKMQNELSGLNASQSKRREMLEDSISKLQDENSGIETTIKE